MANHVRSTGSTRRYAINAALLLSMANHRVQRGRAILHLSQQRLPQNGQVRHRLSLPGPEFRWR